jgi:hypothetical protein
MTDCPNVDVRERLPDLLQGALGPGLRAAVLAHVAQCADCAAELDVLRRAREVLPRAPSVGPAWPGRRFTGRRAPPRPRRPLPRRPPRPRRTPGANPRSCWR